MRRPVVINFGVSSYFGWGVIGINLAIQWARDPDLELLCSNSIDPQGIVVDPVTRLAMTPFLGASAALLQRLAQYRDRTISFDQPVLAAFGNDFTVSRGVYGETVSGRPTIGLVFFENAQFTPDTLERAKAMPVIVAGSTWNARILRAYGITHVETVLQGVDPLLFHPGPRRGLLQDRFMVFSGGKLERRKGQDIVLAAWRIFAARHPEALLVTAWHSPWPALARTLDQSTLCPPVPFRPDNSLDVPGWAASAGIAPNQIVDIGAVPNFQMPAVLREMDAAVFPNRCEGGTNLVAMECMACAVPTIVSANTGHLDLIADDTVFALAEQRPGTGPEAGVGDIDGWGESSVDEIVDTLERIHADRSGARRRAEQGARFMSGLTWARMAAELKKIIGGSSTVN